MHSQNWKSQCRTLPSPNPCNLQEVYCSSVHWGPSAHSQEETPAHKAHPFYEHFGGEFRGRLNWMTVIGYPEQHLKLLVNLNEEVVSAIWPCPAHLEVFVVFPGIVFFVTFLSGLTLGRKVMFRPYPPPGNPGQNAKFQFSFEPPFWVSGSWPAVSDRVLTFLPFFLWPFQSWKDILS